MTDMTPDQKEIEALRAHNAELLGDLKRFKAQTKELATQVEALTGERDNANAAVQAVRLDSPVANMLERVSLAPELFAHQFAKEYTFTLTDDGIAIHDLEGNPAQLTDDKGKARPAQFTEDDIRKLTDASPHKAAFAPITIVCRASGGGAPGSRGGFHSATAKPGKPSPSPSPYGLR